MRLNIQSGHCVALPNFAVHYSRISIVVRIYSQAYIPPDTPISVLSEENTSFAEGRLPGLACQQRANRSQNALLNLRSGCDGKCGRQPSTTRFPIAAGCVPAQGRFLQPISQNSIPQAYMSAAGAGITSSGDHSSGAIICGVPPF